MRVSRGKNTDLLRMQHCCKILKFTENILLDNFISLDNGIMTG